jgi:phage terminase large subunit-like protein
VWQANSADPEPLETVWGGLDLSATTDLTALALVGRNGDFYDVESTFWLPEVGLRDKAMKDRVPYYTWADQGYLNTTPGTTVEYEWVAHRLREVFDNYYVAKIAFDRWNWRFLKPWLERAGFDEEEMGRFEPFGQGYASMSPALRELETVLLEGKMRHGGHPIMTMCAANAVVDMDPAGNRKLTKSKSSGRIDGLQALAMAVAAATAEELEYASGSLITL